ncbi:hypothetical protein [Actinocatenispora rupis]|uniref:Uncharacterized protein n=1 Tax=Actinocatenispora rupis TaxID=519421 RepID=A0A8J3JBN2_9ACTN|nr:hypothetical protein [Actinocatenispora rupis]GID15421.1 hypothetical protein Aru02nite_63100 [Actinocatenispora rupis]
MVAVGLLGVIIGVTTIVANGPALYVRFAGTRGTATVTSCRGVFSNGRFGDQHDTVCSGDWRLPGGSATTGTIDGAARAIGAHAEGKRSIDVHEPLEVWATDTGALAVRSDPIGWLWAGGVLALAGAVVLAVTAWRRHVTS